ncbi:MAG: ATP-binding protein [Gammaproteobacteria bacterium]|nr:MAG: ATP-binding protein [Gammaproteobacteria bacterium]
MEKAILNHNPHWQRRSYNFYNRDRFKTIVDKLHLKHIQVLKGIRRSGKTTLFKLLINHLVQTVDKKSVLYINLDDPYFSEICNDSKNLYTLLELSEKITGTKVQYLFLDEVQNVVYWEKFVKAIYDNEVVKKIFITGSNSSLLDGEYAKLLSGRYIQETIYPLSFAEIVAINKINDRQALLENKAKLLNIIDDMMNFGSFVEVMDEAKYKRDIILSYYDTIIFKDCVANNHLRDSKTFKEVTNFIISNSTNLYSYNSIARVLNINDNTVKEYIKILIDSFLCNEIKQYSYSLKEQIKTKKKIYISDNSFLSQTSFRFSKDFGKRFENLVYTELLKQEFEIYYHNKDSECDFICIKNEKIIAIQVCYKLTNQNITREMAGLKKLKIKTDKKILLTYNQDKNSIKQNDCDDILIVPFWDFFSASVAIMM